MVLQCCSDVFLIGESQCCDMLKIDWAKTYVFVLFIVQFTVQTCRSKEDDSNDVSMLYLVGKR